jgi:hypothetical protein
MIKTAITFLFYKIPSYEIIYPISKRVYLKICLTHYLHDLIKEDYLYLNQTVDKGLFFSVSI